MLFLCYRLAPAPLAGAPPFLITPVLRRMHAIEGWLEEEETETLAQVAQDHLEQPSPLKRIVEIGSYCGNATFVLASVVNALGADASILAEGQPPVSAAKLVVVPVSARPTYRNFFDAINAVPGASDINIVSNSDIYFDDTLGLIGAIDLRNRCLALTQWDVGLDGNSRPLGWQNSQDAWIFRGHVRWVDDASYRLGTPACDWRIAAELTEAKYDLFNPSRDLRAHHLHLSQVRRYSASDFVHGDHADVPICSGYCPAEGRIRRHQLLLVWRQTARRGRKHFACPLPLSRLALPSLRRRVGSSCVHPSGAGDGS